MALDPVNEAKSGSAKNKAGRDWMTKGFTTAGASEGAREEKRKYDVYPRLATNETARLDRALEYAVIQNWDQLMPDSTSGLIHIEYQTGRDGSLDFLLIWASTIRGYWNLVCEYWMRPLWNHATGLRFGKKYYSVDFARTPEFLMGHEDAFSKLSDPHGLLQIYPPTQEERKEVERWTRVAFNHHGSVPIEQHVAA